MGEVWTPAQANRIFRCATLASFRSEGVNYCVSEGLAESRMRARSLSHRTKIVDFLSTSWVRDHYRPQLVGVEIFCGTGS